VNGKKSVNTLESVGMGVYLVVSLGGGAGFIRRLADLGIYPGAPVSVVSSRKGGGPIILSVKGCRFAIGRGMASRIYVKRAQDSKNGTRKRK